MMPLCVSNIAWDRWDDPNVFALLHRYDVTGQELAPGKVFGDVRAGIEDRKVVGIRNFFEDQGFELPAFQAILFGCPEFQVFDRTTHKDFLEYLKRLSHIAYLCGTRSLVLGAPKNRRRRGMPLECAYEVAREFFTLAGSTVYAEGGCSLVLEANPVEYTCDFLTNSYDVIDFVHKLAAPGIGIHLDTGAMEMNAEDAVDVVRCARMVEHFHVSAPLLNNVADSGINLVDVFNQMTGNAYMGWVSIEMKRVEPELENLERALQRVRGCLDAIKR